MPSPHSTGLQGPAAGVQPVEPFFPLNSSNSGWQGSHAGLRGLLGTEGVICMHGHCSPACSSPGSNLWPSLWPIGWPIPPPPWERRGISPSPLTSLFQLCLLLALGIRLSGSYLLPRSCSPSQHQNLCLSMPKTPSFLTPRPEVCL